MSEWIKCSERMPDHMQDVLFYNLEITNKLKLDTMSYGFYGAKGFTSYISGGTVTDTHWMPLPEPPKE